MMLERVVGMDFLWIISMIGATGLLSLDFIILNFEATAKWVDPVMG